eukprot:TRINITY_DN5766_c0_g1_i1.p1 TRINITY_DN5766_c0_g1~~TRINITY_DN5766_c0_g1_i1.p1  ORF type:complete len:142 (+),score=21.73 TRINITY_DN5766_c0_g1_i1:192-617(+)
MDEYDAGGEEALICTCGICMDIFYDPITLPCGHSYCFTCLYSLEKSKPEKSCPMCRERWHEWPKTSRVLNDIVDLKFPGRRKRAEEDLIAETEAQRKELEKTYEIGRAHRSSILMEEGKIFALAILALALLWWKTQNTYFI